MPQHLTGLEPPRTPDYILKRDWPHRRALGLSVAVLTVLIVAIAYPPIEVGANGDGYDISWMRLLVMCLLLFPQQLLFRSMGGDIPSIFPIFRATFATFMMSFPIIAGAGVCNEQYYSQTCAMLWETNTTSLLIAGIVFYVLTTLQSIWEIHLES